jgi:hypothetical protein
VLERNVKNIFFPEKLFRKDLSDLPDTWPGATFRNFLGQVTTLEQMRPGDNLGFGSWGLEF